MKYLKTTYERVWVEWQDLFEDRETGRRYMERNHNSDCTLIDSSSCQCTIVFPEGDKIRKAKKASGLRINGVGALEFFREPSKHYPLKGREGQATTTST